MTKGEKINDILKDIRKNIKPSTGPLTSIDQKKLTKASKDVETAKEVAKTVDATKEKNDRETDKS